MKKKRKSPLDIMRQLRNSWGMNPRTRVQENEMKDKKKRRQEEKRLVKDEG